MRLEEILTYHYHTIDKDTRLANPTLAPGKKDGNKSIGYPLYVTFRLGQKRYANKIITIQIKYQMFRCTSIPPHLPLPLPLPLECPSQEADIQILQDSIEAEIAAEINLLPQPAAHHQMVEEITLDAEIAIVARVPVKVTILGGNKSAIFHTSTKG